MTKFEYLLPASLLLTTALPAFGQGFSVDKDALEQVKPFKARKTIYVLDESPVVKDKRQRPQVKQRYRINIPALPDAGTVTTDINLPGVTGGAPGVYVDDGSLPRAGFESNMHALKPRQGLPGTKMGVMRKRGLKGRMNAVPEKGNSNSLKIRPTSKNAPEIMRYKTDSSGPGVGSSSSRVETGVNAELKGSKKLIRKRQLLNKVGR